MAKKASARKVAIRYQGRAIWSNEELGEFFADIIGTAILRERTLSIDWLSDDKEIVQTTVLTTKDGFTYSGQSISGPGTLDAKTGVFDGSLFANPKGKVLVATGKWEDGTVESFIVQLFQGKQIRYSEK